MSSFYSENELNEFGFKSIGEKVLISKKASIYSAPAIEIGNNVRIDDFCLLSGNIKIGSNVHISAYTALYGKFGIDIGDYCGCSPRTTLFSGSDDFSGNYMVSPMVPEEYTNVISGKIKLNNFVQIGANSIVLPGVILGEGAVTGSFSLVKNDVEPWSIYAGIPAKKIKSRKQKILELVEKLEKNDKINSSNNYI